MKPYISIYSLVDINNTIAICLILRKATIHIKTEGRKRMSTKIKPRPLEILKRSLHN